MRRPILLAAVVLLVCSVSTPAAGQDERTPVSRLRALKAELLAAHPQATAAAIAEKTVAVNCAKHGSISAALASNPGPPPLVIELRGICKENVLIERNDVTLRGADPASDGIQGVTADPQPIAALLLSYANRILLENMFVADSPGAGVGALFSAVDMRNCRIASNGGPGIHISASSVLTGTLLVVSQNTGAGINSQRMGRVICTGCRLEDNHPAATSQFGGFMTLWDTKVSGAQGIRAGGPGSYIDVDCVTVVSAYPCSVNVQKSAAQAFSGGQATLWGVGAFTGAVSASEGGWVGVYGGEQTLPAGIIANQISDSARLTADMAEDSGPTTKLANTHLSIFARAALYDATELLGTLTCDSGADAWSDTPYPAAQVATCKNVPTTP
jgi:hypothetical protein